MKAVLISIQPKWCGLIASGKKTIEVRKTRPKIETPFKCYIYCTVERSPMGVLRLPRNDGTFYRANQKVIGEFVCNRIDKFESEFWDDDTYELIKRFYESDDPEEESQYCYDMEGKTVNLIQGQYWAINRA